MTRQTISLGFGNNILFGFLSLPKCLFIQLFLFAFLIPMAKSTRLLLAVSVPQLAEEQVNK